MTSAGPRYYRPELDMLRFLAFFGVFLAHAFSKIISHSADYFKGPVAPLASLLTRCGEFGLQLFFFLSAFLIVDLLLTEKDRTNNLSVRGFYIRRVFRIWPLYMVGLLIGVGVAALRTWEGHPDAHQWTMLGLFLVMCGNWFFATGGGWPNNPVAPLWSVSVEEQFYLFAPWVVRSFNKRRALVFAIALAALSAVIQFALGATHARQDTIIWANTFVEFDFFAAGMAAAVLAHGSDFHAPFAARLGLAALSIAACLLAAWLGVVAEGNASNGLKVVLGYSSLVVGIAAGFFALLGVRRCPALLVRLGRISYGLYVYHAGALMLAAYLVQLALKDAHPLIGMLVRALIAFAMTWAAGELSYRYLETPFLRLKERFATVQSRPI
jgi:peptidoglycan/LPS O-acetylase OafA/YrhL